jgi:hypothetical protein
MEDVIDLNMRSKARERASQGIRSPNNRCNVTPVGDNKQQQVRNPNKSAAAQQGEERGYSPSIPLGTKHPNGVKQDPGPSQGKRIVKTRGIRNQKAPQEKSYGVPTLEAARLQQQQAHKPRKSEVGIRTHPRLKPEIQAGPRRRRADPPSPDKEKEGGR